MPAVFISTIISFTVRMLELVCSVIVTGIVGHYINTAPKYHITPAPRFIYTTTVSSMSLIYAFASLIFFRYTIFPIDMLLFVLNIAAFGSIVSYISTMGCPSWSADFPTKTWLSGRKQDQCARWTAAETFTFTTSILFLLSGCLALWKVWKVDTSNGKPRPWFRRQ